LIVTQGRNLSSQEARNNHGGMMIPSVKLKEIKNGTY